MGLILRRGVAIGIAFTAALAIAAVLAFAVSAQRIFSVAQVRAAFAAHGIHLRYTRLIGHGSTGLVILSTKRVSQTRDVTVTVAGRHAHMSWGPKLYRYVQRFGNVAVSYKGDDPYVLNAIEAAVLNLSGARPAPIQHSWPEATRACEDMQAQSSSLGWNHWEPLNTGRPLARVAALRRELLVIHTFGLAEIRGQRRVPTYPEARALHLYSNMLVDMRHVIRAAEGRNMAAHTKANIRLVLSISATRVAFERAGAAHICDFAI